MKAGEITELKLQVPVYLTDAKIMSRVDFQFVNCKTGQIEYAEAKGFQTDVWRIKRRLWLSYGPAICTIWVGNYKKPYIGEVLIPKGPK